MESRAMILRPVSVVFLAVLVGMLTGTPLPSHAEALQGITAPKADITLSFVVAGRINDVLVKEGCQVQKDQLLLRLFDEPERIQCQQLKMLAEDRTKILTAHAELAQKRSDFRKIEMAKAKGAASDWEIEHSELNVRIAELALKSAVLEQEQYRRRYDHAQSQLERMRLVAPIAGLVEDIRVDAGESIGTLGPVIRLVQNDPLWIDIPVPMTQAAELEVGQSAWVTFPSAASATSPNGRIINIATVADAASDTLRVRIEVPNPLKRPAGERVDVNFAFDEEGKKGVQLKAE